jgi:heptosyltransferase-3
MPPFPRSTLLPHRCAILIIQKKFLGDLIFASLLADNLRLEYPDARIVFLADRGYRKFLIDHAIADDVIEMDRKRMRGRPNQRAAEFIAALRKLRSFRFDITIDLTDSKTSRTITGLVNAPNRVGYSPTERPLRWWERQPANVLAKPFGFGETHFLYRYLSPLEALNIELRRQVPMIRSLPGAQSAVMRLLDETGVKIGTYVVVHAGAGFIGRQWPPDRFARVIAFLARERKVSVVLVGGPDERGLADTIKQHATVPIADLVGKLSFEETLAAVGLARMFFGNESGPMHMAAASGVPVVGLFGLTDPVKWGPVGVSHIALRPSHPCECINEALCKSSDPSRAYCVWRLSVETVSAAVDRLLAMSPPRILAHAGSDATL